MSNAAFVSIGDLRKGKPAMSPAIELPASGGGCGSSGGAASSSTQPPRSAERPELP